MPSSCHGFELADFIMKPRYPSTAPIFTNDWLIHKTSCMHGEPPGSVNRHRLLRWSENTFEWKSTSILTFTIGLERVTNPSKGRFGKEGTTNSSKGILGEREPRSYIFVALRITLLATRGRDRRVPLGRARTRHWCTTSYSTSPFHAVG